MQKFLAKNRWVMLCAGVIVMACTTFPVLWGVFQADAAATYGITLEESAMLFPMCNAFYGVVSIFGGKLQDKFKPNIVASIGSILMGSGIIMLSVLGEGTSITTLYVCFALPFGTGCGLIAPALMSTLMKWYADKKGFVMGTTSAIASAILMVLTYVSKYLLSIWGCQKVFLVYGITFMILTLLSTLMFITPSREYIMEKSAIALANVAKTGKTAAAPTHLVDFTPGEMLKTKQFWLLFIASIFATPTYMLMTPIIVTLGISRGLSETLAVSAVAIATGASAVGKFIIPTLSDKIGRKKCAVIFTSLCAVFSIFLMKATGISLLVAYAGMVFTYGGWFTLISPFVVDMFGNANAGANMGIMSVQATLASLACSFTMAYLVPAMGPMANHIIGIGGMVIAVLLISALNTNTARLKENN